MKPHSPEAKFLEWVNIWVNEGPPFYGPDVMAFHEIKELVIATLEYDELIHTGEFDDRPVRMAANRMHKAADSYRANARAAMIARGKKR